MVYLKENEDKRELSGHPYSQWSLSKFTLASHSHSHNLSHDIRNWTNSHNVLSLCAQVPSTAANPSVYWAPLIDPTTLYLFTLLFIQPSFLNSITVVTFPWKCPPLPQALFFILSWQNRSTSWTLPFTCCCIRRAQSLGQKNHVTVTCFI